MKFYPLTLEQVKQLEALNQPTVCFCASGHDDYDFIVEETDLDASVFSKHKQLLDSFKLELIECEDKKPFIL